MQTAKEIVILLGLSIAAAFMVNYFLPDGIALVGQWDTSQGVVTAMAKNDIVIEGIEIGTVDEARQLFDSGEYVFVDARSPRIMRQGTSQGLCLCRWVSLKKE